MKKKEWKKIKTKTFIPYSSLFLSNFNIVNWVFVIFKQKKIEEEKEIETMMKTKRKKNEKTSWCCFIFAYLSASVGEENEKIYMYM